MPVKIERMHSKASNALTSNPTMPLTPASDDNSLMANETENHMEGFELIESQHGHEDGGLETYVRLPSERRRTVQFSSDEPGAETTTVAPESTYGSSRHPSQDKRDDREDRKRKSPISFKSLSAFDLKKKSALFETVDQGFSLLEFFGITTTAHISHSFLPETYEIYGGKNPKWRKILFSSFFAAALSIAIYILVSQSVHLYDNSTVTTSEIIPRSR
jgi:hypothetical protein